MDVYSEIEFQVSLINMASLGQAEEQAHELEELLVPTLY
jgi:hypothetical protein